MPPRRPPVEPDDDQDQEPLREDEGAEDAPPRDPRAPDGARRRRRDRVQGGPPQGVGGEGHDEGPRSTIPAAEAPALGTLRDRLREREAELARLRQEQLETEARLRRLERAVTEPQTAPPSGAPPGASGAGTLQDAEYTSLPAHAAGVKGFVLRRQGTKILSNGARVQADTLMPFRFTFDRWPTRWDPLFQEAIAEGGPGMYLIVDKEDYGRVVGRIIVEGSLPPPGQMAAVGQAVYGAPQQQAPATNPTAPAGALPGPGDLTALFRERTPLEAAYANYMDALKNGDPRAVQVAGGAYIEIARAAAQGQARGGAGGPGGGSYKDWLKEQAEVFNAMATFGKTVGGHGGEDKDVAMRRLDIEERKATMDGMTTLVDRGFDRLHEIVADVKPKARDMGDIRKEADKARQRGGQGGPGGTSRYVAPPSVGGAPAGPGAPQAPASPARPPAPPPQSQPRPAGGRPPLGGNPDGVAPNDGQATPQAGTGPDPSMFAPYVVEGEAMTCRCRWCKAKFDTMTFWEGHMPCPAMSIEEKRAWGSTPMPHKPVPDSAAPPATPTAVPAPPTAPASPAPQAPAPAQATAAGPPPPAAPALAATPSGPYAGLPPEVKEFLRHFTTITESIVGYGRCSRVLRQGTALSRCDAVMSLSGGTWSCPTCGNRVQDYETTGSPERSAALVVQYAKPAQLTALVDMVRNGLDSIMGQFRPHIQGAYNFPELDQNQVLALVDALDAAGIAPAGGMKVVFAEGATLEQMKADMRIFVDQLRDHLDIQMGPDGERWFRRFINALCTGVGLPAPHPDTTAGPEL